MRLRENRERFHLEPSDIALAGHEQDNDGEILSDQQLGIGEETQPALVAPEVSDADRITAAMSDPIIAKAIEQLVEQRIAALAPAAVATQQQLSGDDLLAAMRALGEQIAASINRTTQATVEQMPGHVKPIPVEEVEARAAAYIEMATLLKDGQRRYFDFADKGDMLKANDEIPVYLLEEDFFGEDGSGGGEMFLQGETIRWFRAPGTYMRPQNESAKKISEAMWRYIGGEAGPSAEELAAQASQMRRPSAAMGLPIPELPSLTPRAPLAGSRVEGIERVETGPNRINGTVVREMSGGRGRNNQPRIVSGGMGDGMSV
jgi:hypothetical protein